MSKRVRPFKKPVHLWLAKIIRIDTPAGARKACKELSWYWKSYSSRGRYRPKIYGEAHREKKRLLQQSASEAIRRSKAQLQRKTLSPKERREFKEIVKIYSSWLSKHRLGRK